MDGLVTLAFGGGILFVLGWFAYVVFREIKSIYKCNQSAKKRAKSLLGLLVVGLFAYSAWHIGSRDAGTDSTNISSNHVTRGQALIVCEKEAKARSNYPESVSFSTLLDAAWTDYPNGRTSLNTTFTAKNAFGAERKFNISCLFTKSELIEVIIKEAR